MSRTLWQKIVLSTIKYFATKIFVMREWLRETDLPNNCSDYHEFHTEDKILNTVSEKGRSKQQFYIYI